MPKVITYVDDSPDDLFLFEVACKMGEVGLKALKIEGGVEAMAYLERAGKYSEVARFPEPDLLLLDLKMPRIDGFDVLHRIRTDPQRVKLPVALMTSSCLPNDIERAKELGATWYFVKPTGLDGLIDFVQLLEKCLSHPEQCKTGADQLLEI